MPQIVQKIRLFNEAFKLAHSRLSEQGIVVVGATAERLSNSIRRLMEAGEEDAEVLAREAVALIGSPPKV